LLFRCTMIEIMPYTLADAAFLQSKQSGFIIWQPDATYVILGQSDTPETSLNRDAIIADKIMVMKRPSGGHTVLLSPNTLIISVLDKSPDISQTRSWFNQISQNILIALKQCGVVNAEIKGTSDIVINNRKILGSSMYRSKDNVLWHGVLNVSEKPETIARYLAHPITEPKYRQNRNHISFVTSLSEQGYSLNSDLFADSFGRITGRVCLSCKQ